MPSCMLCPSRPPVGTVYDPTFGDDSRNFLNVDPKIARPNFNRMNKAIAELAPRYGQLSMCTSIF